MDDEDVRSGWVPAESPAARTTTYWAVGVRERGTGTVQMSGMERLAGGPPWMEHHGIVTLPAVLGQLAFRTRHHASACAHDLKQRNPRLEIVMVQLEFRAEINGYWYG